MELSLVSFSRLPAYLLLGYSVEAVRHALHVAEVARQIGPTSPEITSLPSRGRCCNCGGSCTTRRRFPAGNRAGQPGEPPGFCHRRHPVLYQAHLLRERNRARRGSRPAARGAWSWQARTGFLPGSWTARTTCWRGCGSRGASCRMLLAALEQGNLHLRRGPPGGRRACRRQTRRSGSVSERYMYPWCATWSECGWLALGDVDRAVGWAEHVAERRQAELIAHGRPSPAQYRRDCEDVARARVALARACPDDALGYWSR